jgi:hypothetical protein
MNVDIIDKNALSFIMGQIVAMETCVTSTVLLRLFRYFTETFMYGPHTCVLNIHQIVQELTILEN